MLKILNLSSEKVDRVLSDLICSNKARDLDFYVKSCTFKYWRIITFLKSVWATHGDGDPAEGWEASGGLVVTRLQPLS